MAQSTEEILKDIVAAKNKNDHLKGKLKNDNTTSVWKSIYYTFATGLRSLQLILDKFKDEIQKLIDNQIVGTLPWYVQEVKKFELGAEFKDGKFEEGSRSPDDIAKSKIVKFAAATESDRKISVKVYGATKKLTDDQVDKVQSYLNQIKFAGTDVVAVSNDADRLRLDITLTRTTPYILSDKGASISDGSDVITKAIKGYLENLPYNGRLTVMELGDALQVVAGIDQVQINKVLVKAADKVDSTEKDLKKQDKWEYIPVSGFFKYDKDNSTINIT